MSENVIVHYMDYNPEKRLRELKNLISKYIDICNEQFKWQIECDNVEAQAEKILLVYNDIIHFKAKPFVKNRIDRTKIAVATQFAIMFQLPLRFASSVTDPPISIVRLNAELGWKAYISLVIDFPSINDSGATRSLAKKTEVYEHYKENYIIWLTLINPMKTDVIMPSWFLLLFTQNHLLER